MNDKEYRAAEGINKSALWHLTKNPAYFKYMLENPQEPTPALLFGQAIHKMILEPDDFLNEFAVMPQVDRRTKEGKEIAATFELEAQGKTIINQADMDKITAMAFGLQQSKYATSMLNKATAKELPIFWTDERSKLKCKCKVDGIVELSDRIIIFDYKTTMDASENAFMRAAIKYGYDVQAAHYIRGIKADRGNDKAIDFVFIAQEKTEPYCVNVFQADDDFIEFGLTRLNDLMEIYQYCTENDDWYGYEGKSDQINLLGVPSWASAWEDDE